MSEQPRWQRPPRRTRHLDADTLDPPRASRLGDALLLGFGVLVLIYFLGEFGRLLPWKAILG